MSLTTSQIYSTTATKFFPGGNQEFWAVTVPSGGPAVGFYADALQQTLLASVAAGASANFANSGGFFYSSITAGGATVVGCSNKMAAVTTFTTVGNTGAETVTAQFAIPADVLFKNAILRVKWQARCTSVTSTPTLQAKLYMGGAGTTGDTLVATAATTAVIAAGITSGEMEFVVGDVPGATVALVGTGWLSLAGAIGSALQNASLVSTNFATNAIVYLTLTLLWSASSASNVAVGTLLNVEIL